MSGPLIPPGQRPGLDATRASRDRRARTESRRPTARRCEEDELGRGRVAPACRRARGRRERPLPKQAVPGARLLVVEDLKTHFTLESGSVKAVDGVSFTLDYGEALGIAGESGCGKTTTALSLVRLLPGEREDRRRQHQADGDRAHAASPKNAMRRYRWREISDRLPGRDECPQPRPTGPGADRRAASSSASASRARRRSQRADELLELVGIPKKRGSAYPHELSGGMRQRAMIAMALACDPAIVIGDEPTTALDVMVQAQILQLLEELRAQARAVADPHHPRPVGHRRDVRPGADHVRRSGGGGGPRRARCSGGHGTRTRRSSSPPSRTSHADRRTLDVIPGSPPDLRDPPPGCRFAPRCFVRDGGLLARSSRPS